ncbi:MAG: polyprenol monophosphomannose synthase [Patescibacteria group bacterium]
MISLIIPTYKEKENIGKLLFSISQLNLQDFEVIVVDDNSPDKTAEEVEKMMAVLPLKIKLIKRKGKRDLSLSVLDGFKVAKGEILGVMDADFSHPPEIIPQILKELKEYDLVIASRKIPGSEIRNWPLKRKITSGFATFLAKILKPEISDPLSGFFFFKRKIIEGLKLSPIGYKIGLEIFVKGRYKNFKEVSYIFEERKGGKSKLNWKVVFKFLFHILRLWLWKITKR